MIKTDPQLKGNIPLEKAAESMSSSSAHFTVKTVANDIAALTVSTGLQREMSSGV